MRSPTAAAGSCAYSISGLSARTKAIDPVDVKEGVAERPRHERIHLDDDGLGVAQHAHRDVDRDAEADEAVGVGRRHLHEGDICLDAAVLGQMRDLGE